MNVSISLLPTARATIGGLWSAAIGIATLLSALAAPSVGIDLEKLGKSLGGWEGRHEKYAEYVMADSRYRTFKPDITPTPDGGIYLSLRIDHVRGLFAADDHAILELTVDREGQVQSTRSSVNIQGKRITSDLIAGGVRGAGKVASGNTPAEMAVSMGTSLVANLAEKLGSERKIESGRVSFPSVVQHNFNLIYQAVGIFPDLEEEEQDEESSGEPVASSQDTPGEATEEGEDEAEDLDAKDSRPDGGDPAAAASESGDSRLR